MAERVRRRRRRRRVGIAAGAFILLAAGIIVARTSMSSAATYRVATAVRGDPRTGLSAVGTLRPVNQAAVAFPIDGRIATVDVHAGQRVTAGQQLASLVTTEMSARLAGAHATVAKAQASLDADQASQHEPQTPADATSSSRLTAARYTLLADQHAADVALAHVEAAVAAAAAACPTTAPSAPSPPASRPTASPTGAGPPPSGACQRAQAAALDQEIAGARAEKAVAADEAAVNQLLSTAAGAHPPGPAPATADQLAADRATLDAAVAAEQAAQQDLDQAKLLSPEDGLVEAVNLTAGTQVSAESTTQNVVISSSGGEEVVIDVPVGDLASVSQGERATVVPDGSTRSLGGTVTAICVLPTTDNGATCPVTVVLAGGTDLPDGATATVLLAPAGAGTSVVVPTSAVTATAHGATVQLYRGGHPTTVAVTVGVSGPVYTEIRHGIEVGQRVVLANLATPLPVTGGGRRALGGGRAGG